MTALHAHSHTCLVSLLFIPSLYITFFNSKNFLIVFVKILKAKTVALHKYQVFPIILNCKAKTVLCLIIDYFYSLICCEHILSVYEGLSMCTCENTNTYGMCCELLGD